MNLRNMECTECGETDDPVLVIVGTKWMCADCIYNRIKSLEKRNRKLNKLTMGKE